MLTFLRNRSLTQWILVAMLVGTLIGHFWPEFAKDLKPLSDIFLRMIKSLIAPLIFATLVIGIASHGDDMKRVGRLALKSIFYFEVVTTLALVIGLVAVNLTQPGVGLELESAPEAAPQKQAPMPTVSSVLEHIVPASVVEAAARNEVLQVVFWSILFGVALAQIKGKPREFMLTWLEALAEVMFKFTGLVMKYAPIGIAAAVAFTVASGGLAVIGNVAMLILTLYAALAVFIVAVLVPTAWIAGVPVGKFIRAVKEPALIAFSTASSEAALPKAMLAMKAIGVPRQIVAFVIPTGYTFNLDGTTLYLAVASVFAVQVAGHEMSLMGQITMMLTLMLTSKGVAGVPRAAAVILVGTLESFNVPQTIALFIVGVDQLLDMGRTAVNLIGNCLAACVIARWEGEFGDATANAAPSEVVVADPPS